jgi:hypothetical protein
MTNGLFPEDSAERKTYPIFGGLLQYFPSALAAIAHHSYLGNAKHNAGLPLHHDRAKSDDEPDALARHLMEGDYVGMAWRALSLLQKDLESKGAPIAPAARNAVVIPPPPEYDPDDVAFRKPRRARPSDLELLHRRNVALDPESFDHFDTSTKPVDKSPDLRHIGIGDIVPTTGRAVPISGSAKAERDAKFEFDVRWDRRRDKTAPGTPADSAYLASFGPNVADVQCFATSAAIPQHPMAAEALRDHDERLAGPESHL